MEKEKRTKVEKLRFTEAELDSIKSRVPEGETRSGWIRRILLNEEVPTVRKRLVAPEVAPELMRELGKIGGNLNQIARVLNQSQSKGEQIDLAQIFIILKSLDDSLSEIKENNKRKPCM